mmetsp:Transcript_54405/g.126981  ORF Transcript_54405/g.126981 Transcript_54405/m.126981 type:complete len:236 (+) Transcript_54405:96-803(+)
MDWPLSKNEKVARLLTLYDLDVGQATRQLSAADAALEALVQVLQGSAVSRAAQVTRAGNTSPPCAPPNKRIEVPQVACMPSPSSCRRSRSCQSAVRISDVSTNVGSLEESLWCPGGSDIASDFAEAERIEEVVWEAAKDAFRVFLEQKAEAKWQTTPRAASHRRKRKSCRPSHHRRRRSHVTAGGTQGVVEAVSIAEPRCQGEEPTLPSLESFLGIQTVPDFPFPSLLQDVQPLA